MRARDFLKDARILVADDEPDLLELVVDILLAEGADPIPVPDGAQALQALDGEAFDLVLLDGMMPGFDGFQVAQRLRGAEAARGVKIPTPVLMLTALSGQQDIVAALDAGADDYLVKPFHHGELLARAGGLLRIRRGQERVASLLTAREQVAGTLVHDLRTPLSAILLNAAVLLTDATDDQAAMAEDIREAGLEMSRLLDDVLLAARSEAIGLVPNVSRVDMGDMAKDVVERIRRTVPNGASLEIFVEVSAPQGSASSRVDDKLFRRILDNLLGNAVKYGLGSPVAVRMRVADPLFVEVADGGPGIPEEMRESIFEPFVRAHNTSEGFGVGLSFCRTAVEAHGGRIWADESDLGGASVRIEIPQSDRSA